MMWNERKTMIFHHLAEDTSIKVCIFVDV